MTIKLNTAVFGAEDLRICQLMDRLGFDPGVIYDIGASNGAWTRKMQSVFPNAKYELFEPQAHHNESYRAILLPFVSSQPRLSLHTEIVSDEDGTARLRIVGDQGVGSSILGTSAVDKSITVDSRRLDTLIQSGRIPKPDMIKMDIQGAELLALKGGVQSALPAATVLALELWISRGYGRETPLLGEVNEFLKHQNFYPFDFGDVYRQPDGVLVAQDVWYCRMGTPLASRIWQFGV